MALDVAAFGRIFEFAYAGQPWPAPLRRFTGDMRGLTKLVRANLTPAFEKGELERAQRIMGSLIIGQSGERAFQQIYAEAMQTAEIRLVDDRSQRTDADFILKNGNGLPLYRINIKLHGSLFEKALDHVGLVPEDCFALATYKIGSALEKQNRGHLPYLFIVVTAPGLRADEIGRNLPTYMTEGMLVGKRFIKVGKRAFEERLIEAFERERPNEFAEIAQRLRAGRWFIFSARRAEILMKEKLFERVFALRQPGFNRAFRNAEIDMHLSFSYDMLPLDEFLNRSKTISQSQLISMIERGTI